MLRFLHKFIPKNDYLKVFWLCFATAVLLFLPYVITDQGHFLYYGDFNVQQIPFYKLAHEAVRSGEIFWNWNTDLGANFIGSYSFYLLGSPFFWLTLPFPNDWVPYLMAPLLVLKFACAGVSAFAFIKRFTKTNRMAILGGLLYAFCGFNIFNIFFNHFLEPVIIFPLMLVALEEAIFNNRRGWLAVTIAISAMMNYYFLVGQAVFLLLYFIVRVMTNSYPPISLKLFFRLAFESILGLALSCFLLLPSVLAILGNTRIDNMYSGMNMLFYGNEQRYGLILQSLFYPPDIPARPIFFPDSNAKWASVSLYLPLFSTVGIFMFFKHAKKHWAKPILIISLIMSLIPVLNSVFSAMNSNYYARWFYMPVLLLALITSISLEHVEWDYRPSLRWTAVGVAAFSVIGILPNVKDGVKTWFSISEYPQYLWEYVGIAVICLLLLVLLFSARRKTKHFFRTALCMSVAMILLSSYVVLCAGREQRSDDVYDQIVTEGLEAEPFGLNEETFFRVDDSDGPDNIEMFWGLPSIQCFHSIVPASIMEFYPTIGVDRDVASRPEQEHYALRGLTSVRYLFSRTTKTPPTAWGFEQINVLNNYNVFENNYFIPMGFTYDHYVTRTDYDASNESYRDELLLNALCLSDKDAARFGHLLTQLDKEAYPHGSEQEYYETCTARQQSAGSSFTTSSRGFTSTISLDRENLVFYSVPYEDGWTATVNGEPAEIVKANVGFMAVVAPAGDNEIVFSYYTPGLNAGIIITGIAVLLLLGYLGITRRFGRGNHLHRNDVVQTSVSVQQLYLEAVQHQAEKRLHRSEPETKKDET